MAFMLYYAKIFEHIDVILKEISLFKKIYANFVILKFSVLPYRVSSCDCYIVYINKEPINSANKRYMIYVLHLRRDMIASNIP